jgi:RNA polymerase sigma-70 factor (ECF subfamily)
VGETPKKPEQTGRPSFGLSAESDRVLVGQVANGDEAAYAILVTRHSNRHLAFAERVMGDRAEAEDAVQEAFIKLWTRANSFEPSTAKFTTWFYRVVLNQCLDRKRKKRPESLPEGYDGVDERESPSRAYEESEAASYVKQKLAQLPERQRYAITLCYYEGLSNKEAAEILGLGVKALESLLTRGRKRLKKAMDNQAEDYLARS